MIRQRPKSDATKEKIKKAASLKTSDFYKQRTIKSKKTLIDKYGVDSYAKTDQFKKDMIDKFGYISPFSLKKTHDKSKETLKERYGVDHNFKIDGIQDKIKETFNEKYDVNRPSQNEEIKKKGIDTCNLLYGGNSPMNNIEIQEKSKSTMLKNHGVEYTLQSEELRLKMQTTTLEKHGYAYYAQSPDKRDSFRTDKSKYKTYIINGINYHLQGYEDYVLIEHILKIYSFDDILIKNVDIRANTGLITYNSNKKEHVYFPDFYIKTEHKIIEVKSKYTFNYEIDKNILKKEACEKLGLAFEFIIIDNKIYDKWSKLKLSRTLTIQ